VHPLFRISRLPHFSYLIYILLSPQTTRNKYTSWNYNVTLFLALHLVQWVHSHICSHQSASHLLDPTSARPWGDASPHLCGPGWLVILRERLTVLPFVTEVSEQNQLLSDSEGRAGDAHLLHRSVTFGIFYIVLYLLSPYVCIVKSEYVSLLKSPQP
jgi:hypothetical protein